MNRLFKCLHQQVVYRFFQIFGEIIISTFSSIEMKNPNMLCEMGQFFFIEMTYNETLAAL